MVPIALSSEFNRFLSKLEDKLKVAVYSLRFTRASFRGVIVHEKTSGL